MIRTASLAVCALTASLLGCAGQGTVPDGYESAMNGPPGPGKTPTAGLLQRSQRALVALSAEPTAPAGTADDLATNDTPADLRVAAGDGDTVSQLLAEQDRAVQEQRAREEALDRKQDFLFLIAGSNVGQQRFVQAIETICDNTELASADAGSFPTTLVLAEPRPTQAQSYRYHVDRAVTLNAMLAQTNRFSSQIIGGESIGLLLISSRRLRDALASVQPNLAATDVQLHPSLPDVVAAIDADDHSRYIAFSDVKLYVVRQLFPKIAALGRGQRAQVDQYLTQLTHPLLKVDQSDGRLRGSDPPLRDLSAPLSDLCGKLGRISG